MKRQFLNWILVVTAMLSLSLTVTPPFPAHGAATIATTSPTSVADTHLLIEALDNEDRDKLAKSTPAKPRSRIATGGVLGCFADTKADSRRPEHISPLATKRHGVICG